MLDSSFIALINDSVDSKNHDKGPLLNSPSPIPRYGESYPDSFLKYLSRPNVYKPMKHSDWVRVSAIGSLCPRKETLRAEHDIDDYFNIDGSIGFSMMMGDMIHDGYRFLLGSHGEYVGSWKCLSCGKTTDDYKDGDLGKTSVTTLPHSDVRGDDSDRDFHVCKMPEHCALCGSPRVSVTKETFGRWGDKKSLESLDGNARIVFNEWKFYNSKYKVRGHWDGARYEDGDVILQEIKSCSGGWFKKMGKMGGFDPHIKQLLVEMWLTGIHRGELVYVNKSGWGNVHNYLKIFPFDYNDDYMEKNVFYPLMHLRECLKKGIVSHYRICQSPDSDSATNCIMKNFCFDKNGG